MPKKRAFHARCGAGVYPVVWGLRAYASWPLAGVTAGRAGLRLSSLFFRRQPTWAEVSFAFASRNSVAVVTTDGIHLRMTFLLGRTRTAFVAVLRAHEVVVEEVRTIPRIF